VETEVELEQLREAKCDEAQGFLLGRPAPLASLRENGSMRDDVLIDRLGVGSVYSEPTR
jgi:EAL domain-containing protein (putative c-di-GMP-specific phosphodiesterase class I)